MDNFYVHKLSVMVKDSKESTDSLNHEVNSLHEISSIFNEITYDKVSFD